MSQTKDHTGSAPLSPPLNSFTDRISLLFILSQPLPRQNFSTAIGSSLNLFNSPGLLHLRLPLGSIAGPIRPQIQWLSDRCIPRNTLDSAIPSPGIRPG
ncbi:hypothetical protein ACN38_g8287 [Penicillium nordicum]|uniref:Uncharacterized protein n=1 Tax=Penicillium nordicum TaxID=229535 RepID=A0A0N0RYB7_9EURO|nr:hypothetical protein ACN38_g8287 [Penicillium nordicum]